MLSQDDWRLSTTDHKLRARGADVTHTDRRADRCTLPGDGPTDEDLEHELELTRRELGGTVTELAHRLDVKSRVEAAARHKADRAQVFLRQHRMALTSGGAGLLAAVLVLVLTHRR